MASVVLKMAASEVNLIKGDKQVGTTNVETPRWMTDLACNHLATPGPHPSMHESHAVRQD